MSITEPIQGPGDICPDGGANTEWVWQMAIDTIQAALKAKEIPKHVVDAIDVLLTYRKEIERIFEERLGWTRQREDESRARVDKFLEEFGKHLRAQGGCCPSRCPFCWAETRNDKGLEMWPCDPPCAGALYEDYSSSSWPSQDEGDVKNRFPQLQKYDRV